MESHPVQLRIDASSHPERIHVLIRGVLLLAIAAFGCSAIYWVLFVGLPALVALRIVQIGSEHYLSEDAPRITRVLRWLASAHAYLWLLTDVLPTSQGSPVDLAIAPGGRPTPGSALLRIVLALPALVLLFVLSAVVGVLWLVGAIAILIGQTMPSAIADFITFTLRFQFRLAAYHLSLVERYPSFERSEPSLSHAFPEGGRS